MDIAAKKLELMQRLMAIADESTLQRVAAFFKKEVPTDLEEDDLTDEELSELNTEHARVLRGEGESYTVDEAMAIVQQAIKR